MPTRRAVLMSAARRSGRVSSGHGAGGDGGGRRAHRRRRRCCGWSGRRSRSTANRPRSTASASPTAPRASPPMSATGFACASRTRSASRASFIGTASPRPGSRMACPASRGRRSRRAAAPITTFRSPWRHLLDALASGIAGAAAARRAADHPRSARPAGPAGNRADAQRFQLHPARGDFRQSEKAACRAMAGRHGGHGAEAQPIAGGHEGHGRHGGTAAWRRRAAERRT